MQIRSTFHVLVLFMAMLTVSMPFVALAQSNAMDFVKSKAAAVAEADATADTDTTFWFSVGLLGNIFGVMYANYNVPVAPTSRLLGKSPEYVAFYSDAYMLKAKKLQSNHAARGCLVQGGAIAALCGFLLIGRAND